MENALSKAIRRYGEDSTQENYTKVIHELFWAMVNENTIYYVVDDTCKERLPMPSKVIGGDGQTYVSIFSRATELLDEPDLDVAADSIEEIAKRIIMRDDIQGIVFDMDTGADVIVLTNYLVTLLHSVNEYRAGLE